MKPALRACAACLAALAGAQREPGLRALLLRFHIPTLVQLGIIAYVVLGWQYLSKVGAAGGYRVNCASPAVLGPFGSSPMKRIGFEGAFNSCSQPPVVEV